MKRRRFLQLFGLSPAAVAFSTPGVEPDLLPADLHEVLTDPNIAIEPATVLNDGIYELYPANSPLWDLMSTATALCCPCSVEPAPICERCDEFLCMATAIAPISMK